MLKSFTGVGPELGPRAVYLDSAGISLNSLLSGYHGIFRRHPAPLNFIEFGDGTRAKGNVQNHVSH